MVGYLQYMVINDTTLSIIASVARYGFGQTKGCNHALSWSILVRALVQGRKSGITRV